MFRDAMAIAAVGDFVDVLRLSRLLEPAQLTEVVNLQARFQDSRELARHLLQKGWLTPYQINQIFQGNVQDLVLGQYKLLERLGEGGMGQVFKARHLRLDRVVALKVIRKEKLDNPQAVRRFQREIRAAAQLSHPNIVMAFDADQAAHTNFFVMEYVEGIDLNRLVKESGPLPIEQACEYIRQAALGLQHAFECGLVHRDIKPANLLVSGGVVSGGVEKDPAHQPITHHSPLTTHQVKILDMGLARIGESGDSEVASRLTQEGMVMGTPDFIAPEQAMNSSTADIRADLYSLGCSLFFLLTSKVLFPGGTMMEKIMKHRSEPPPALEKLRPEVPPRLAGIVHKLLAKKPEDRYQTPAEVAEALAAFLRSGTTRIPGVATLNAPILLDPDEPIDSQGTTLVQVPSKSWRSLALIAAIVAIFLAIVFIATSARRPPMFGDPANTNPVVPPSISTTSLLDKIPADQFVRGAGHPKELVALLGKPGEPLLCVAFSGDGKWLAVGGEDNLLHLWNLADLSERTLLPRHAGAVAAVAFHPDSKTLASGSQDGKVQLWDVDSGRLVESWEAHELGTDAVAFSPDGTKLASAGEDYKVKIWDVKKPKRRNPQLLSGHDGPVFALAFAADGATLASAGRDKSVRLWDMTRKKHDEKGRLRQHGLDVLALAFSPDGRTLASAGRDKSIRLWKLQTGERQEVVVLDKHTDFVYGLAFAPGGKLLASVGKDAQVFVWDVTTKAARSWMLPWAMRGVAFAADGRHFATANHDGTVAIFRLEKNPESGSQKPE